MKKIEALTLNTALNNEHLKVKNLTGAQYVSLIGIKRPLARYIDEMNDKERGLYKDHGIINDADLAEKLRDRAFKEKLEAIQADLFEPKEVNFIPLDEFKKFTDEVDFATGSVLAEYLLVK